VSPSFLLPVLYGQQIKWKQKPLVCGWEVIDGRVLEGDKSSIGDDMKFLSIFCHTITTHTYREPHALASPTVNFSSLDERTEERRRIRKPDAWERGRDPFYGPYPKSRRSPLLSPWHRSAVDRCRRRMKEGKRTPLPLLQMCSSFLKPPMPHCPFFFLSRLIFALCVSVSKLLCLFFPLIVLGSQYSVIFTFSPSNINCCDQPA
jgi:hypothetical protein